MRKPSLLSLTVARSILLAAAAVAASGAAVAAASPSEILQKAIYTEETVGNIDEAVKLYEQVIAEGKTARNAAAQAQFRIAMIYLKKNKKIEGNAALEKLIKDYPEEKELLAKARKLLPSAFSLEPAPWKNNEALEMTVKLATGLNVGTYLYTVREAKHDDKNCWLMRTRTYTALNDSQSLSSVLAEKESFLPIKSAWNLSLLGDVSAVFKPQVVEIKDLIRGTTRDVPIEGPVFDNEQAAQLFRRLPLAVGYKTTVPVFPTLTGLTLPIEIDVKGKETIEVGAGKFECFKMHLSLVNQVFYISTDEHRYLVRFDANGASVELNRIFQFDTPEARKLETDAFTATLPDDWFAYTSTLKPKTPIQFLLNMDDTTTTTIVATPRSELEDHATVQAWVDKSLEKSKEELQGFKVREGSRQEIQVAGQPAVQFIADYSKENQKLALYATMVLGEKSGLSIKARVPVEKLEAYRKLLDKVIESLQFKS